MDMAILMTHEEQMQQLLDEAISLYELRGVHPAAELMPFMDEESFDGLVKDLQENGFQNPVVVTSEHLLLDGRNRICASIKIQLDAPIEVHSPTDPVQYVLSENLHRRHLTVGQRAMLGLKVEAIYAEEAKKRQLRTAENREKAKAENLVRVNSSKQEESRPRTKAAKAANVGSQAIQRAKKIAQASPALVERVEKGESLNKVYKEAQRIERELKQLTQQPENQVQINAVIELPDHLGNLHEVPKPKSKATFNPQKGTEIGWALWSWNPVTGCNHGCDYCYARAIATSKTMQPYYPAGFTPLFHWERLDAPKNTNVPKDAHFVPEKGRVFVCSMADLFGAWVPQDWIDQVVRATKENEQWEYLYLTKFPQRYDRLDLPSTGWIGASIDTQQRLKPTMAAMQKVSGVKVKWLSLEPLLEPLHFDSLEGIDWIVIGAQSQNIGQNESFAPHFEWVMDIVTTAKRDGCKVWLKTNLLGRTDGDFPGMQLLQEIPQ